MEKAIKKYFPIFALPTFIAFIIGFIVPFIMGIYLSFCKFSTLSNATFTGIDNYLRAFSDNTFLHALGFTTLFTQIQLHYMEASHLFDILPPMNQLLLQHTQEHTALSTLPQQ